MTRGLGCALALIIAIALVTAGGCGLLMTRIADYGQAREVTKQVEIRANADVSIAQINANATVDVAQINANAKRDTSLSYLAHRLLTALLWAVALIWALAGGAWLTKRMVKHGN